MGDRLDAFGWFMSNLRSRAQGRASTAETRGIERRTAKRYRVPGSARVFWGGDGTPVSIADMSSGGCLVLGDRLPDVGTRVFLSLDIGGLPNVRLPAVTVRSERAAEEPMAALRFEVPTTTLGGLDKLLAQHVRSEPGNLTVLVVDSDDRSRERIAHAARTMGAKVRVVGTAIAAMASSRELAPNVVLARADAEGLATLDFLTADRPQAFRVAFGRKHAIEAAVALGIAQAAADDPCSPKCLGELLRKGRLRTSS
ncbi:MAG: PilZ domain [Myxococcaceae bacterium]|nr:PilZ domain [Myxococcaceae bacterium]